MDDVMSFDQLVTYIKEWATNEEENKKYPEDYEAFDIKECQFEIQDSDGDHWDDINKDWFTLVVSRKSKKRAKEIEFSKKEQEFLEEHRKIFRKMHGEI